MSRVPLVHLDQPLAGAAVDEVLAVPDAQRHHLTTVLRLGRGDVIEVADGVGGHARAELAEQGLRLRSTPTVTPWPRPPLRVVHGLPKGRKLDEVVRALVELGVDEVQPVAATRSVRRPDGARADKAVARWRAVARSACEQARRRHLARIAPVVASRELEVGGLWLLAHPPAPRGLPQRLADATPAGVVAAGAAVTIAIGPEGGWDDDEVERLTAAGASAVHLGPTVLRTEHAGAAAVAVLSAWLGRWDRPALS